MAPVVRPSSAVASIGTMANSPPVRTTAFISEIRLTRTKPGLPSSRRNCSANGGRGPSPARTWLRDSSRVSLHREPGDDRCKRAGRAVGDEGRGEPVVLGEQAAREGSDAHREQEGALVDGDHAPAALGRADVGQHHLPRGEDQAGARTRHKPGDDELGIRARPGAPQVAEGGDEAADRQRRPPPQPVRQLSRGQRGGKAREAIGGNGKPDR